jgi:hypothetical protein
MRPVFIASTALCFSLAFGATTAATPHEHGAAQIDIAVDAQGIVITLETPLENLLGFERAPRSDAEHKSAAALKLQLQAAAKLFRIDPAAGCDDGTAELSAPVLGWGKPATQADGKSAGAAHADLDASFSFRCTQAGKASYVDVALWQALTRLNRIKVQVASNKGQGKAVLQRAAQRVTLPR